MNNEQEHAHVGSGSERIVVDWDGTCVENAWPAMGDWLPGARTALRQLLDTGWEVVVYTTRLAPVEVDESTPRPETMARETLLIREMLDGAGLQGVAIWNRPWKPGAVVYIDDKAIRYKGSWNSVLTKIPERSE